MSRPTSSSSSSSSTGSWSMSPQFQGWNHQVFDLEHFKYIFGQQEQCIMLMQSNNNQVVQENNALKWQNQQLENQISSDKERIKMLEEENEKLKRELAVYRLSPGSQDNSPFIFKQSRGMAGYPQLVEQAVKTEQFYNFYRNRAMPTYQKLDKEERKKWKEEFQKMRKIQKDQLAKNLIQYVKKELYHNIKNSDLETQEIDESAQELLKLQHEIRKLEQEALEIEALKDDVERQQERIEVLNVKIQRSENANESLRKKIGS